MGVNRLFWPQELLDQWVVEEKIVLNDDVLEIPKEDKRCRVVQALHFVSDVGDGSDPLQLIGKVKELSAVEEMGGEYYMDSVLLDDAAYQVVPGFMGEVILSEAVGSHDLSGAIASSTGSEADGDDQEILAKFLLENL